MKKILVVIAIGMAVLIIYFAVFLEIQTDTIRFLDIIDHNIIQNENGLLFLSAMALEKIPEISETNYQGFGFGWLNKDGEKLSGYISNIHLDSIAPIWHTELITINDTRQFCFDDAEFVISNVMIQENNIKVIVEQNDMRYFDRVISYEIIKDSNCHLGYAGKIIDEYKHDP